MKALTRMLLAGMLCATAVTSPTHGRGVLPIGSMSAAMVPFTTSDVAAMSMHVVIVEPAPAAGPVLSEGQLATIRGWIQDKLVEFGRDDAFARDASALLTPADLAVLAANPRMMQPAGDLTARQENLLWAALIIGGLVALILAADSSSVSISA